jgi:hypothetical protein
MAELKAAVAGVRQTLAWIGARVTAVPAAGGGAGQTAAPAAVVCPPAGHDEPVPPEEAAQAARASGAGARVGGADAEDRRCDHGRQGAAGS